MDTMVSRRRRLIDTAQMTEQVEISRSSSRPKDFTTVSGPTMSHTIMEESSSQHDDLLVSVITTHHRSSSDALVPPSQVQHRTRTPPDQPIISMLPPACSPPYDCGGASIHFEETDEDNSSTSSSLSGGFYLDSADFLESTWASVVDDTNMHVGVGMLAIATTAVIVHPLIFVAGAGVAAASFWAVGLFGDVLSYEYFSDSSFTQLFWKDAPPAPLPSSVPEQQLQTAKEEAKVLDLQKSCSSRTDLSEETPMAVSPVTSLNSVPEATKLNRQRSDTSTNNYEWIERHFPPLENEIVSKVELPGLNASKFFEVFFSDDAPFTFREFQKKRGDIDIAYGSWGPCDEGPASLHRYAKGTLLENMEQRTLKFKTLTKSYFGPAYATAIKTQRVTTKSKRLVVLESKTRLEGIPFCDRFQVVERWIVETPRKKKRHSLLSVFTEVQFLKSCSFESQIRKKSFATVTEVVTSWCEMAKEALERTAAQQSKRKLRQIDEEEEEEDDCHLNTDDTKEQLMARHEKRLKQLEEDVKNGGLESIEVVQHSGKGKTSSRVVGEEPVARKSFIQLLPRRSRSLRGLGRNSVRQVFSRKASLPLLSKASSGR